MVLMKHKFDKISDITLSSFDQLLKLVFIRLTQHKLSLISCVLCVKAYIQSLILSLSLNISQIYYHYKMMSHFSQTYQFWKQLIKIKPICHKLIFKRLLFKFATDCKSAFTSNFYRQTVGCTMSRIYFLILVTCMDKTENEVVTPLIQLA